MAQPLRKIRQRIAPAVPKGGFSFTLPPLAAGAVCIVMLACIGWAFFMGYMVGHGQNPGEEMRELTGIGRPDRETLAEMDKAMAGSEKTAAPAKPQAATNGAPLYDFVFQVAAFRNVDDADRLRQRLEGQGLRTRGQKSGKLTLVMVHMRGTDLDAANLKEELQRMRLGSPLQKSKKRVGGKPRPR